MSVITRFHIQNFKAFRDSTPIDITPFTLIVGPNGSGKTSILEALELTFLHDTKEKTELLDLVNKKTNKKSKNLNIKIYRKDKYINIELSLNDYQNIQHTIEKIKSLQIPNEERKKLVFHFENFFNKSFQTNPSYKQKQTNSFKTSLYQRMLCHPCYDDNEIPSLREDGYGLASVISNMMTSDPDAFLQLQEAVRNVLPSIKRIRTRRAKVEESHIEILRVDGSALERPVKRELIGSELVFDTVSSDNIPASDMSEGAMIVLALLTEILRPGGASLLLIDDLERGIHPGALQSFVAQLRALFKVRPDLQIIATTHSPYLVTEFAREEILMTTLDDEGYALCAPMTANDQWDKWKDIAVTGEFWGIIGEDWIKELRKNA
jgi:AAA15 family ATPase/GTPase